MPHMHMPHMNMNMRHLHVPHLGTHKKRHSLTTADESRSTILVHSARSAAEEAKALATTTALEFSAYGELAHQREVKLRQSSCNPALSRNPSREYAAVLQSAAPQDGLPEDLGLVAVRLARRRPSFVEQPAG